MSKTPVHAALERLGADGLVTVAAQQGIVVREVSPADVADHFEIREALEPFVVARLAGRLDPAQAARLAANLEENRRAVAAGDAEANARLGAEFHLLLCGNHGNREVARVMAQNREKVHAVIRQITGRAPARLAASLAEHRGIAEALLGGDGNAAAARMVAHLRSGLRSIYERPGRPEG